MGKSRKAHVPSVAKRGPVVCIGCQRPIVYGDRCPPCAHLVKVKAAKRRRKR